MFGLGFFYYVLFLFPLNCIKIAFCTFFSLHFSFSMSNKLTDILFALQNSAVKQVYKVCCLVPGRQGRRNLLLFLKHLLWEAREILLPFYVENVN